MIAVVEGAGIDPLVAVIVSVPPTLAALAAWRQSRAARDHSQVAKEQATAANHAVNHRPEGAPTLVEQVDKIAGCTLRLEGRVEGLADEVREQRNDIATLAVQVGSHGRKLDEMVKR